VTALASAVRVFADLVSLFLPSLSSRKSNIMKISIVTFTERRSGKIKCAVQVDKALCASIVGHKDDTTFGEHGFHSRRGVGTRDVMRKSRDNHPGVFEQSGLVSVNFNFKFAADKMKATPVGLAVYRGLEELSIDNPYEYVGTERGRSPIASRESY